jgi:hypothetical protein
VTGTSAVPAHRRKARAGGTGQGLGPRVDTLVTAVAVRPRSNGTAARRALAAAGTRAWRRRIGLVPRSWRRDEQCSRIALPISGSFGFSRVSPSASTAGRS